MNLSDYMRRTAQDSERASVAEILAGGEVTPDRAHRLRAAIEVAAESYDDATAAEYPELYPAWDPTAVYAADARVQYQGVLYKCLQDHTAQADWTPDAAPSLWEEICESHAGTLTDPIPYSGNMALTAGLYYIQDYTIYRCTRDTGIPVYNPLAELVGIYVEAA